MSGDEDSKQGSVILKRLSVNTCISAARIFDEDSNDSVDAPKEEQLKSVGKMKTKKKSLQSSPYKANKRKVKVEYETDPIILERRQKQIDYGKNTVGYDNYIKSIPKHKRKLEHPKTPLKHIKYSRRGWDGLIKMWRQKLHEFDPEENKDENVEEELNKPNNILEDYI